MGTCRIEHDKLLVGEPDVNVTGRKDNAAAARGPSAEFLTNLRNAQLRVLDQVGQQGWLGANSAVDIRGTWPLPDSGIVNAMVIPPILPVDNGWCTKAQEYKGRRRFTTMGFSVFTPSKADRGECSRSAFTSPDSFWSLDA